MLSALKLIQSNGKKVYATWNPADKSPEAQLYSGNLACDFVTGAATSQYGCRATIGKSSGKWYWELHYTRADKFGMIVGIGTAGENVNSYPGSGAGYGYYHNDGKKYHGGIGETYASPWSVGAYVRVCLDMTTGTLAFAINNGAFSDAYTGLSGTFYPFIGETNSNNISTCVANFGQSAFQYAVPSGFNPGLWQ